MTIKLLAQKARDFLRANRGNVAMLFGLSLVPLTVATGVGLDFARAALVRSEMNEALDAAALAVGSTTGLSTAQAQSLAQQYFNANYKGDPSNGTPSINPITYNANGSVTVSASDTMPTVLLKLSGYTSMPVTASSTVVWGQSKLWVSLVLDNTGSMTQTDSTGTSKISALKTAANQLLTTLQNVSATAGDVQVSIVPFAKLVNVGTSDVNQTWVDWSDWNAQPPTPSAYSSGLNSGTGLLVGPGNSCPWTTRNDGFGCITAPAPHSSSSTSTIPSSGTYSGYICPSVVSTCMGYFPDNGR